MSAPSNPRSSLRLPVSLPSRSTLRVWRWPVRLSVPLVVLGLLSWLAGGNGASWSTPVEMALFGVVVGLAIMGASSGARAGR